MDLRRNLNPLSIACKHKTNGECMLNVKCKRQVPFNLLLSNEVFYQNCQFTYTNEEFKS